MLTSSLSIFTVKFWQPQLHVFLVGLIIYRKICTFQHLVNSANLTVRVAYGLPSPKKCAWIQKSRKKPSAAPASAHATRRCCIFLKIWRVHNSTSIPTQHAINIPLFSGRTGWSVRSLSMRKSLCWYVWNCSRDRFLFGEIKVQYELQRGIWHFVSH